VRLLVQFHHLRESCGVESCLQRNLMGKTRNGWKDANQHPNYKT
jgi:hypothetical protein